MGKFFETYKQSIILLMAIVLGTIVGIVWGANGAKVLSPLGDLFLNLLLMVIVPLIFLTITTSISNMKQPKRLGKIMTNIILVFVMMSLVAVLIGFLSTYFINLVEVEDGAKIMSGLNMDGVSTTDDVETALLEDGGTLEKIAEVLNRTVGALTVSDFAGLFSRQNILAIIVFSILFGLALNISGEKAKPVRDLLVSATDVVMSLLKIIMYYAPIGLGCYFAALVGTFGASIAVGYAKTFVIYTVVAILFYFVIYSLYAYIAAGKKGFKAFWANIIPATVTALATCSSAASIPANLQAAKAIGVPDDIAEPMIPLGTSFHKDGSVIGSVFKIMFLVCLFGTGIGTVAGIGKVIGTALLVTLLVTAVPIGGGTISEMMILVMMGYPVGALPILTIIATIIDPPATVLNVIGDTSGSMLVARMTDGKDWLK